MTCLPSGLLQPTSLPRPFPDRRVEREGGCWPETLFSVDMSKRGNLERQVSGSTKGSSPSFSRWLVVPSSRCSCAARQPWIRCNLQLGIIKIFIILADEGILSISVVIPE